MLRGEQAGRELVNSLSRLSLYGNSVCFWSAVSTQMKGVSHFISSTEQICCRHAILPLNRLLGGAVNETRMPNLNH